MRPKNHGIPTRRIKATAMSRGTAVSDWSCRLVKVCTRLSKKLSNAAATSRGAATSIDSLINCRSSSATMSGFMFIPMNLLKALQQRTCQQVPSIDHHKKQDFQGSGNHYRGQLKHADGRGDRCG